MIHSKLKKGQTSQLLVQFYKGTQKLPKVLKNFQDVCKQQKVRINKSLNLQPNMLRIYTIQQSKQSLFAQQKPSHQQLNLDSVLKTNLTKIELKFLIIYVNDQQYQVAQFQQLVQSNKQQRAIILRETMDGNFFHLEYQVQNTMSEQESLIYLCDLVAMIINCKYQGEIEVYDQKKHKMIKKGKEDQLSQLEVIWKNIIYQTPGLGRDKCKLIADKYPTYQHLINDYDKGRQLKNLMVQRGTKQIKIGSVIADRIYKIFNGLNGQETLF